MSSHTVTAFDEELGFIARKVAAMGGQAERLVDDGMRALIGSDRELAAKVIADDAALDAAQRDIDERAVVLIARRQPFAGDLREVIGAMRIASDLERVGDLGKSIAKRTGVVPLGDLAASLTRGLQALVDLALTQLKEVLDVYASREVGRLAGMRDRDREIDAIYTSLFRELLTYMMEDPRNIAPCTHLLFCAKNIERIGDHATNIAETIFHITTGEQMPPERPKDDESHEIVVGRSHG